ncbi:MAG: hypothetical protein CMJ18_08850 [Phycisphaeraceae bacterium]|nr:hypothetical protein [Phycisphaeraceae bacterium]
MPRSALAPAVLILLLAIIVGVPVLLAPPEPSQTDDGPRLVVLTPHNEQIRYEFGRRFNRWRVEQGRSPVQFDWRTSGGTSDLRRTVMDQFRVKIRDGREDEGIGCDLFFGGGDYEHGLLARGLSTERDGASVSISLSVAAHIPEGFLEEAYGGTVIGSEPLYDKEHRWLGVALSSFGIVYNRDVHRRLGLDEPRTWSDLVDRRYAHWVALADPAHSGSIGATYNAILRHLGWDEGWRVLRRVFANARYFTSSAGKVPVDVSAGEAAAGMCIDFYGRFQAGAIGGDRIGYVDPAYSTAITADPISILRGAPNREVANEFVLWLLSIDAQQLWQRRKGSEDGPERFELRRLPIRRDVYTVERMKTWTDRTNPYDVAASFPAGMPNFYRTVAPVSHALAIDIHADLRRAWEAIGRESDPARRAAMEAEFDAMPEDLRIPWPDDAMRRDWKQMLSDPDHARHHETAAVLAQFMSHLKTILKDPELRVAKRLEWTGFFRARYRSIASR